MDQFYLGVAVVVVAYVFFMWLAFKCLDRIDFIKASGAKTVREIQNRLANRGR